MNNTNGFQVGDISVIQIFVQLCDGFVHSFAKKVDLCGYAGGLGHTDLAGTGSLHGRCGDLCFIDQFKV